MSPRALTLEVAGLRLAAKAWGPPDGPPVLAAHGWLDNAATFDGLCPLLPGLHVVAIDFPGHGLSQHRAQEGAYHFLDLVVDLCRAADALGLARFSLLGHSMGAAAASLLAGTCPDRVRRMVLIEGLGPLVESPEQAPDRLAHAIEAERRTGRLKRVHESLDAAAEKVAAVSPMARSSARCLVERGTEPVAGGLAWRADPRLRHPSRSRLTEAHVRAFLRRIACPTLLIGASDGFDYDPRVMAERAECVEDLKFVQLAGGHHLHLDDPGAVAAVVGPFLQPLFEPE
jgi:pimeloyl-ACP methyl ester carboxylesterase